MKIGKKLYVGFGSVLVILVLLLVVNLFAGLRERSARLDASNALESVRTIEAVRYQIMLNRLNLNNYLLSGDPRDEERVNKGLADISEAIKRGQSQASTNTLRTALTQVENTETNWADNFAKPLLAKRHQVDSGDATVSDLQIFYLQKDPGSWLVKSSTVLDRTNQEISRSLDETSGFSSQRQHYQHHGHYRRDAIRFVTGLAGGLLHRQINYRPPHSSHYCGASNRRFRGPGSEHRYPTQ